VLPATAFGNVIVAFLSRFWLHEAISLERWAGIVLITLGVSFVAQGPSLTQHPAPIAEEALPEETVVTGGQR
jgi:drug/metabolite transporter (DMT)-like permease